MLACARIGAVHSVIFGGFSPDLIAGRVNDCGRKIIITADEGRRGGKTIPLKKNVDEALTKATGRFARVVVKNTGGAVDMKAGRDVWYEDVPNGSVPCSMTHSAYSLHMASCSRHNSLYSVRVQDSWLPSSSEMV